MTEDDILALPYRPCVGVMVINPTGAIWVGKRIDNPGNAWQMPQGGIDPDEPPRSAAFRELEEETSIRRDAVTLLAETSDWVNYDLPFDLVPKLWKGRYRGQAQKWFLMRYDGPDTAIRIDTDIPEFSHWAWMEFDEVLNVIVPFKRDVYAAVWKEFGPIVKELQA